MTPAPRYAPFVSVFVPFALALTVANLYAELSPNLTFGRVQYTILISAVFALPAVALFFLRTLNTAPPLYFRYWQLFWTFGFIGYALHFYYSVGAWFGWDFSQIWRRQGTLVVTTNYLLLVLWAIDVTFAIRGPRVGGVPGRVIRWAAHVLFVIAFVVASVVFRSDIRTTTSLVLGFLLLIVTGGALLLRWRPPPVGRMLNPGTFNPQTSEAVVMSSGTKPNPVSTYSSLTATGGEANPALERQALTRPNLFVILFQAYKDFVGKDVQQTTTYSYVWSADQAGHVMLGFVPTFLLHWLAIFLFEKQGLTLSLFGFTFHETDQIINCALLIMTAWIALETWDFIDSSIKISRSSGYFQGNFLELFWNVVTALFYFALGATIAGASSWGGAYAFEAFLLALLPGFVIAFLWLRTKILFQRAGLPFLYRLPNYDGVLDFSKSSTAGPVPAPLTKDAQDAVAKNSAEAAERLIQLSGRVAESESVRRAIRAYVWRYVHTAACDFVQRAAEQVRKSGPTLATLGTASGNDGFPVGSIDANAAGAAAEQAAQQNNDLNLLRSFNNDKAAAIDFINAMRASPLNPLCTYAPGPDTTVPRRHLIVAGPQNSGKTSLAVGIGTEFAFRFPSGGIGRYMTMSDLVQIIEARASQNVYASPRPPAGGADAVATPVGSSRAAPASSQLINADPKNSEFNDGRVLWKWASVDLLIVDDVVELLLPVRRAVENRLKGQGFRTSIEQLVASNTDLSQYLVDGNKGLNAFFDKHLEDIRMRLEALASPEAVGRYVAESYAEVIAAIKRIPRVVWVLGDMILPELFEAFIRSNFGGQTEPDIKLELQTVRLLPPNPVPSQSTLNRNWKNLKNWLSD